MTKNDYTLKNYIKSPAMFPEVSLPNFNSIYFSISMNKFDPVALNKLQVSNSPQIHLFVNVSGLLERKYKYVLLFYFLNLHSVDFLY